MVALAFAILSVIVAAGSYLGAPSEAGPGANCLGAE